MEHLIKPKRYGGLGLGDLDKKNQALLAKWRWRFEEAAALWRKIIANKYGDTSGLGA